MKGRTITQELNTRRIRGAVKIELREARSEVKLTEINGISELKFTVPSLLDACAGVFLHAGAE